MTDKKIQLTADGLEELKAELDELTNVKLPKIVERVANAREKGDLSENADYQSARDEQTLTHARMSDVERVIENATVVKQTTSHQKIGMGSTTVVMIKGNTKKTYTYHMVGEFESDPEEGKVSIVSPIGKALMNKRKGDEVIVKAPAGNIVYVVKEIK